MAGIGDFFFGSPEVRENVSTLRPEQEDLYDQLIRASQGQGAGGAFGQSSDYYRSLLGNNSEDFNAFAQPQMRQFNEQIIPGLAEQFAGMGAGGSGLSGSGFRNAAVNAGTDLSERLGAIRAQLRQQGAQGLQGIGTQGLGNFSQNMVTEPGTEGFLGSVAPAIGTGLGMAIGGPLGAGIGAGIGGLFKSKPESSQSGTGNPNMVGQNSPWQGRGNPNGFSSQLPNFNPNMRSY